MVAKFIMRAIDDPFPLFLWCQLVGDFLTHRQVNTPVVQLGQWGRGEGHHLAALWYRYDFTLPQLKRTQQNYIKRKQ